MSVLRFILSNPAGRRVGWSWLPPGGHYHGWRLDPSGPVYGYGFGPFYVFVYWV